MRLTTAQALVRWLVAQRSELLDGTVHHRVDFAASMIDGRTVGELASHSRSAEEIASLWKYVFTQLQKSVRRRRHA